MGKGEGKGQGRGEGKGGCLDAAEGACDCVQAICGCICCLLFAGPILIIIGIIFISQAFSDARGNRIDDYNGFVKAWNNGNIDGWNAPATAFSYSVKGSPGCTGLTSSVLKAPVSNAAEDLGAEQGAKGFDSYTIVKYVGDSPPNPSGSGCTLTYTITSGTATVATVDNLQLTRTTVQSASQLGCTRPSSSSYSKQQQAYNACQNTCRNRGGTVSGTDWYSLSCTFVERLDGVCVRLTKSGDSWIEPTGTLPDRPEGASGAGCFRTSSAWEPSDYSIDATGAPSVTIRHERDPYLYFLDISDGSKDFGLTTSEELSIGFSCLIIGIVITCCVCSACFMVVRFARKPKDETTRPNNPVTGALYDVAGKYGNYIPGGTAIGYPAGPAPGVQMGPPPPGYPTQSTQQYSSNTGTFGQSQPQYAAPPQYGSQPPYGYPPQPGAYPPPAGQPPAHGQPVYQV